MALITCRECGKEISDMAESCPNCGYPMKSKPPYYLDIEVNYDTNLNEWYYDTKNHREVSYAEYALSKDIYDKECEEKYSLKPGQIPDDILMFMKPKKKSKKKKRESIRF